MTTPEQPPYEKPHEPPISQPAGAPLGAGPAHPVPVQTVKRGPGWGTYIVTILALLIVAAVVVFVLQNTKPIEIKFLSWKQTDVKTAVALGAAAIGGLLAGLFLGLIPWVSARRKIRTMRKSGQF